MTGHQPLPGATTSAPRISPRWRGVRLHTIGHSTRSLDELVSALRAFGVSILVDIRTIPRSRHNPQFERETLRPALRRRHLRYVHLPALGGLRHAVGIRRTPAGGTGASGGSPTTCRRPSSKPGSPSCGGWSTRGTWR